MRTAKRVLSLILALTMLAVLSVTAFAADGGGAVNPGNGAFGEFGNGNAYNPYPDDHYSEPETVTLTFETNGGTELLEITVTKGTTVDLTDYLTEKENNAFTGWYLDADLTKRITEINLARDITIYAGWEEVVYDTECPRDHTCPMYPFADLDRYEWYHDGVHFCIEHRLMQSTSTTEQLFAPYDTATRAMIVTVLWRLDGSPKMEYQPVFSDVDADDWYVDAVMWAVENEITLGYGNGKFGSNDPITREQMISFIRRFAEYLELTDESVPDMSIPYLYSDWAENDAIWAYVNELLDDFGTDMSDLTQKSNRAEIATLLYRFCKAFLPNLQ